LYEIKRIGISNKPLSVPLNRFIFNNRFLGWKYGLHYRMVAKPPSDSITEAAYRRIRGDLLACRLRPGEKIKISQIQDDLDISLCAVREALARLTSEGFVTAEPQKGFRVAPVSVSDLDDLTTARVEIEGLCLRNSINHGSVEWETRLVAANYRLSRIPLRCSTNPNRYNQEWNYAHDEFHCALVAACRNKTLLTVREQLFAKSARYRWLSVSMSQELRDVDGEHKAMTDAAVMRDADTAAALLTIHIKETARLLAQCMDTASEPLSRTG
jgi:DNA-binding GntR family transcriptional regulator